MDVGTDPPRLVHAAFFYRDVDQYLGTLAPFILEGVALGEQVLVAVPPEKLQLLRRALGGQPPGVRLSDMAEGGGNPARMFTLFADATASDPNQPVRMVGEPVWPGRHGDVYAACVENEALWNMAFADRPLVTLCPYDAAGLDAAVVADARATHPQIWDGGAVVPNTDFEGDAALRRCEEELSTDPAAARFSVDALTDLTPARAFARAQAESLGLPADRMADLELIVGELTANSLKYTGGGCSLALWPKTGGMVCEVRDGGRLDDPLAGRRPAGVHATGGRGLMLVNAMADLVRIQRKSDGTVVQAHLDFDGRGS